MVAIPGRGPQGRPSAPFHWHEHDPSAAHPLTPEGSRVEVGAPAPDAEVETVGGPTDHLTAEDPVALADRGERQVDRRRSQPIGMGDGHVELPCHPPGEGDHAGTDGAHAGPRCGGVLDAPVPGEPRLRWRPERIRHRCHHRRPIGTAIRSGPRASADPAGTGWWHHDGQQHRDQQHRGQQHRGHRRRPPGGRATYAVSRSAASRRLRSWSTDLVWIWLTRLSVTPRTEPICARVRFSK